MNILNILPFEHFIYSNNNAFKRVETCNPSISGDIGGLEFFGEVDITKPPVELEGSKVRL